MIGSTSDSATLVAGGGEILLLSMRRVSDLVAYCITYEFEDVIAATTGADRVDVLPSADLVLARRAYKLARYATRSPRLAAALAPKPRPLTLKRDYELFFPVFNHVHDVYALAAVPEWRQRCKRAACFVLEAWADENFPDYLLEMLAQFEHVFTGVSHVAPELERRIGRPCSHLPLAADVLRFSPYPQLPTRFVDVCNIGRRSAVTHEALMIPARERRLYYHYDTVAASGVDLKQRTFRVQNQAEHRMMLASLLQRTRYYFANRARVNEPKYTGGYDEASGRFYEGAAAGTVMLGVAPTTALFKGQFDWPDAVIEMPFDCPDVESFIGELDRDAGRLQRIRTDNARFAAQRHDWLHRLKIVFDTLGIAPTAGMLARDRQLQALAAMAVPVEGRELRAVAAGSRA